MKKINDKRLKILIICPLRYVGSMAFVMDSASLLAKQGHYVDFLVSENSDPIVNFENKNVKLVFFKDKNLIRGVYYFAFFKKAWVLTSKTKYDLIIGISQIGLIVSFIMNRIVKTPYIYYNDELWLGNERNSFWGKIFGHTLKYLERWANKRSKFSVTQDPTRGKFLSVINKIPYKSIRYLPNSRAGEPNNKKSKFLHEILSLKPNIKIILWLGAVSPGDGALELAQSTGHWPEDLFLVFHFRSSSPSPYMSKLLEYDGKGHTIVSKNPVQYSEVENIIQSSTIGLGLYAQKGINTEYMGYSSGKINIFLKYGVPVIASNFKGLHWVETSQAGVLVSEPNEILIAAKRILADYELFQRNSIECFDHRLNFKNSFFKIEEEIKMIVSN